MIGVALMRALFGRWRPRGTDITYPRDQRLHRKSRRASEREGENEGQTEGKRGHFYSRNVDVEVDIFCV